MKIFQLSAFALLSVGLMTIAAFGQQPSVSPTPPADDAAVKITTSLIQLDVVVTDKNGKPATGLRPEDFQVYQDGKLQSVTALSFVNSQTAQTTRILSSKKQRDIPPPPANPARAGRIITFVLDDGNCLATWDGLQTIRDSMKRFIDEQMLPDDRVAIYRTKGGSSLLQMYTSNKEILRQKIAKLSPLPEGGCASAFNAASDSSKNPDNGRSGTGRPNEPDPAANAEASQRGNNVIGTVGVLDFIVDRLRSVPQRKLIFLLSEGILTSTDNRSRDALLNLADKAARASVAINTFSAKGLTVPGMIGAEDDVRPDNTTTLSDSRRQEEKGLNDGLSYLANATGGVFVRNKNFLDAEIRKTLDLQTAYYLVSYEPTDETFKGKEFHQIEVRLTRPDLKVSSRSGFYGHEDLAPQAVYKNPDSPLYQALSSPFQDAGIEIDLTVLPGNTPDAGDFIRPIFHISGDDLSLTDEPDGSKKVVLDVVIVIIDEKGKVIDDINRTYTVGVPKQSAELARVNGLDFSTDIPIKKPGIYSFRVAVRNNGSKKLGSASDMLEIPDAKKRKFGMSGLITTGGGPDGTPRLPAQRPAMAVFSIVPDRSVPSIRQYRRGSVLFYTYTVYNASPGGTSHKPELTREVRLFKDGKLILDTPEKPIASDPAADPLRITDIGNIRIASGVEVGQYVLQVIVRDKVANRSSTQWIDFEVTQ